MKPTIDGTDDSDLPFKLETFARVAAHAPERAGLVKKYGSFR
jgi:hypothetical protein